MTNYNWQSKGLCHEEHLGTSDISVAAHGEPGGWQGGSGDESSGGGSGEAGQCDPRAGIAGISADGRKWNEVFAADPGGVGLGARAYQHWLDWCKAYCTRPFVIGSGHDQRLLPKDIGASVLLMGQLEPSEAALNIIRHLNECAPSAAKYLREITERRHNLFANEKHRPSVFVINGEAHWIYDLAVKRRLCEIAFLHAATQPDYINWLMLKLAAWAEETAQ